jgi:hypothetical protein
MEDEMVCENGVCRIVPKRASKSTKLAPFQFAIAPNKEDKRFHSEPLHARLRYFYGKDCPHSKKMEPEIKCLGDHLQHIIDSADVLSFTEYRADFHRFAKSKCAGVPFLIDIRTNHFVCGWSSCDSLKEWTTRL